MFGKGMQKQTDIKRTPYGFYYRNHLIFDRYTSVY